MSRAPSVFGSASAVLKRTALLKNPYFASMRDGTMSLARFRATQEQFYFAVQFYARPIAALISRIPEPSKRLDLLHNLVEEHGDFREEAFHQNTFGKFLESIGGRRPDGAGVAIDPSVHAFNSTLMGACMGEEIEVGVSCLGLIELAFAGVSELISKVVVDRGWVQAKDLVHYALHAELDIRHAEDLFAVVEPSFGDARGRTLIERGLELGAFSFDELYRNLLLQTDSINA